MYTPVGTTAAITVTASNATGTVAIPNESCGMFVSNVGTAPVTFTWGSSAQVAVFGAGITLPPNTWTLVTCNKATTSIGAISSGTGSILYLTPVSFNG